MWSKHAIPSSLHATASPSMMQERERTLGDRLDDEREAIGQIIAGPAVELHPFVVLTGYDPKPVVLDFVQPDGAGGRLRG